MKISIHSAVAAVMLSVGSMAGAQTIEREVDVVTPDEGATATVKGDLRGLKPGDRLMISLKDPVSGQRQMLATEVRGTVRGEAVVAEPPSEPTSTVVVRPRTYVERSTVFTEVGTAVEFLKLDPATRKVTVLGEHGQEQIFYADEKAMRSLVTVEPGQKIFLSYRFNEAGKAEALVRTGRPTARRGATVEVLATDPARRSLVVRGLGGDRQTFTVDDEAADDLAVLEPGDIVLIGLKDERVMAITRKR